MQYSKQRALTRIGKFLSTEQTKYLSEAYIMPTFKYCPLIWMFCNKTSSNQIKHKRTLRLIYEIEAYRKSATRDPGPQNS